MDPSTVCLSKLRSWYNPKRKRPRAMQIKLLQIR